MMNVPWKMFFDKGYAGYSADLLIDGEYNVDIG